MYKKVSTSLDFNQRELEVLDFWKEHDIFGKSIEERKEGETFTFYDGPPTANGKPHIGHVLTRVYKDIIPRYKTMKGYKVLRKAGWDTHGLPVEIGIEKELGISGKQDIENYGVEPFIKKCKESVWKYEKEWEKMSDRVGYWADMKNPYVTYHDDYIESIWWALKKIWDKDLLYKGHKIVPYCPRCGTSLSSHEVAQGYKDVKETSIYVKFKLKNEENAYFLAWTTTPWTLPSNVALTVNPKEEYVKVESNGEKYILAKALLEKVMLNEYSVLEEYLGIDLEKFEYQPLFTFEEPKKKAYYVCVEDFVTLTDGTGIVHTAPAFGEDDAKVGRKYDLPFMQLVNDQGTFVDCVEPWKGIFVKDADEKIIKDLDDRNLVYKECEYEHSYPFCWRCHTPLLYYARDSWFIKMTEVKNNLLKNNNKINWIPESIGQGRFGDWLENVIDWGISRERYWGTPLPIWECDCGHRHAIGSKEELRQMAVNKLDEIELHKPYIDEVKLNCPECKVGHMKRVSEVIDAWFDSGSMPFAQWHYPFENEDIFRDNFPADFISEAVDQTRGWFYTLLAISTLIFDEAPFKNVIVLGHVNDKDGKKMSKHIGNVIDPWEVLDKQGADAVRWYFCNNSSPWLPSRFYGEAVSEVQRKFMGTLWNTYAFYILYADIDKFDPTKYKLDKETLSVIDKWILSKLNTLVKTVDSNLENYKITESTRIVEEFVDELSNWYVRRCRERFWATDLKTDKVNAYMTLYTVLSTLIKVVAPFVPFVAESIYQNLVRSVDETASKSIHLEDYPVSDDSYIDKSLEENMKIVLKVVTLGRACRNVANIKNRQPLSVIYMQEDYKLDSLYEELILDELNIKKVKYISEDSDFVSYKVKPDRKVIGPKYGKLLNSINQYLQIADGNKIVDCFNKGKEYEFEVDGSKVSLIKEDVLVETTQREGVVSQSEADFVVTLDLNLTEDLIEEGFVREIISKVQLMRKEANFNITDNIKLYCEGDDYICDVIKRNRDIISQDVLANSVSTDLIKGYNKQWNINGKKVIIGVEVSK